MKEIVVLSGKGGTGKTTFSAALSTLGKGMVVADCDVDAANLYLILQPENYLEENYISGHKAVLNEDACINCGACVDLCRFDAIKSGEDFPQFSEVACEGCQLCYHECPVGAISMSPSDKSRLYEGKYRNGTVVHARLAPGEENSGKLVSVVREHAKALAVRQKVDVVIIDGPPGIGCPVISSVTGAAETIIVTEPTKSGFHDLKRILALAKNFKVKISVIINKYDLNIDVSDIIESWCFDQDVAVLAKLPFDKKVVAAMIAGRSIVEYAPECEISNSIRRIFNTL